VYKTSSLFRLKRKALDVKVIESSVTSTYYFRSSINISKSRVLPRIWVTCKRKFQILYTALKS